MVEMPTRITPSPKLKMHCIRSKPGRSGNNDRKGPGQGFTPYQADCPATILSLMKNANATNNGGCLKSRAELGQKYIIKRMLPALLLIVVCGCGPGYNFSPFIGQQQNWTTQPGGYVKVVDKVTLYPSGQFPSRPYTIIGSVTTDNEHNVAKAVHDQQADAALISIDRTYRTGTVGIAGPGVVWGIPLTGRQVNAQLIKYN